MKDRFFICMLILFSTCSNLFAAKDTSTHNLDSVVDITKSTSISHSVGIDMSNAISVSDSNFMLSDIISSFTLIINAMNNVITSHNNNLTLVTIIVAILGVLIAIAGIWGFSGLKKDNQRAEDKIDVKIKDFGQKLEGVDFDKLREIANKIKETEDNISKFERKLKYQDQYIQKINQHMYIITQLLTDKKKKTKEEKEKIQLELSHYHYKTSLLLSDPKAYKPALDHFSQYGTLEDIKDLEYIANNDPDETKRNNVRECIGMIRGRS